MACPSRTPIRSWSWAGNELEPTETASVGEGREEVMSYWDTDYWPTSKCALCNVLEQVIRARGGLFKGYYVRRFRRYVEDGMMPGAAASKAAPGTMPLALALQGRALRKGRGSPFPLTAEQERAIETLARQVLEEIDRLERENTPVL